MSNYRNAEQRVKDAKRFLRLRGEGKNNVEIGKIVGFSEITVKNEIDLLKKHGEIGMIKYIEQRAKNAVENRLKITKKRHELNNEFEHQGLFNSVMGIRA